VREKFMHLALGSRAPIQGEQQIGDVIANGSYLCTGVSAVRKSCRKVIRRETLAGLLAKRNQGARLVFRYVTDGYTITISTLAKAILLIGEPRVLDHFAKIVVARRRAYRKGALDLNAQPSGLAGRIVEVHDEIIKRFFEASLLEGYAANYPVLDTRRVTLAKQCGQIVRACGILEGKPRSGREFC
jgi:hypothetical protein